MVVFQKDELVFHLIVLELQGLQFSLKVVHFFSLAVKIVLHEWKLSGYLLFLFKHLGKVLFGLFEFPLLSGYLLPFYHKLLVVGLVFFFDLI